MVRKKEEKVREGISYRIKKGMEAEVQAIPLLLIYEKAGELGIEASPDLEHYDTYRIYGFLSLYLESIKKKLDFSEEE